MTFLHRTKRFSATLLLGALAPLAQATVDFESEVLPIIEEKCFRCHSERIKEPEGGVLLNTPDLIMAGNEYGPIITRMLPDKSVLVERISLPHEKLGIMPPVGKGTPCTPEQIETIRQWIKEGSRFGDWAGTEEPKPGKKPKQINRSRLSVEKYGTKGGIHGLDLTPDPKFRPRLSPKMVKAKAAEIDQLVEQHRRANGVSGLPQTNDRIFSRRAYLGIVGRTPTLEESLAFLSSSDPKKRSKLIDQLIVSEGYVSHWYNFWADLLKVKTERFVPAVYYGEWIKEALRNNMPYDQFSYKLVTATGMAHQNGATGWTASDPNMAPDHMANTVQVFLGMQLQCAQCHDHPYDQWNQYQFQSLVSYYGGVRWNGTGNRSFLQKIKDDGLDDEITEKQEKFFRGQVGNNYRLSIWEPTFNRWNRLPEDYQYTDGRGNQAIPPHIMFGNEPDIKDSPREAFGHWITSEENTRFTEAIVNRLWKQTMGVGLIEPVDSIKYNTQPAIPELLTVLQKNMKLVDYNLKDFLRILYNTKTWQLATLTGDLPEDLANYHYEGRPLMRMTGEQMWDSLVSLAIVDPDERKGHGSRYTSDEFRERIEEVYTMSGRELMNAFSEENIVAERQAHKIAEKEAYKLFNSKSKKKAGRYGANFRSWSLDHMTDPRWYGMDRGLVRASELASPAPSYHFIRQFGQSDRKIIGTGRTEPNVTQVLNMLNGPIHSILDNDLSVLSQQIKEKETADEKLTVIFRSVLSRNPTDEDLEIANNVLLANNGRQGYRMILWALLNTREFMFIQ